MEAFEVQSPETTLSFPLYMIAQIENFLFRERMKALEQPRHGFWKKMNL